jgi:hypothetical protein
VSIEIGYLNILWTLHQTHKTENKNRNSSVETRWGITRRGPEAKYILWNAGACLNANLSLRWLNKFRIHHNLWNFLSVLAPNKGSELHAQLRGRYAGHRAGWVLAVWHHHHKKK